MGMKGFLERPEGVGFWTMMLLSLAFVLYSYLIIQTVDWLLVFVLIIAGGIFRVAWGVFAWRRPLSVPIEKVERISFWVMILLSLGLLTLEYLTAALFNYYLFYVFVTGLFAYCAVCILLRINAL